MNFLYKLYLYIIRISFAFLFKLKVQMGNKLILLLYEILQDQEKSTIFQMKRYTEYLVNLTQEKQLLTLLLPTLTIQVFKLDLFVKS